MVNRVITKDGVYKADRHTLPEAELQHLMEELPITQIPDVIVPDELNDFYHDLGSPFFHSETKEQIIDLSELQIRIWNLHGKYRLFIIIKSQKIGVSSICILITLWHALKDCRGMELIINAQSDEQAKTHAQDLRRILMNSEKYRKYLITQQFTDLGLLKDEVTKIHQIWLHNPTNPRQPTKIIIVGMSPGALLSHKRVGFIWSSDITISGQTPQRQAEVWASMLSRLANSQGPIIVECPARAPAGPVYDAYEKFQKKMENKDTIDPKNEFYVEQFPYQLGIRDGFFTQEFIDSEKERLGPIFGAFYSGNFFASGSTWYKEEHFKNQSVDAAELIIRLKGQDDTLSDITDD